MRGPGGWRWGSGGWRGEGRRKTDPGWKPLDPHGYGVGVMVRGLGVTPELLDKGTERAVVPVEGLGIAEG